MIRLLTCLLLALPAFADDEPKAPKAKKPDPRPQEAVVINLSRLAK